MSLCGSESADVTNARNAASVFLDLTGLGGFSVDDKGFCCKIFLPPVRM